MKKSYYFLAGMALLGLMTGCSNELDEPGVIPNGDVVRIMFEAPEALQVTRAVTGTNSAQGGLTNVDWSKYDLRYQVAAYSEDGDIARCTPDSGSRYLWTCFLRISSYAEQYLQICSVGRFCKTRRNVRFALQHVRVYQQFDNSLA